MNAVLRVWKIGFYHKVSRGAFKPFQLGTSRARFVSQRSLGLSDGWVEGSGHEQGEYLPPCRSDPGGGGRKNLKEWDAQKWADLGSWGRRGHLFKMV